MEVILSNEYKQSHLCGNVTSSNWHGEHDVVITCTNSYARYVTVKAFGRTALALTEVEIFSKQ